MGTRGRPKAVLELTLEERETLERWARRPLSPQSPQSLAFRSRIVLRCADGSDNATVASSLKTSAATVGKWRSRFVDLRLDGLADEQRPGAVRQITDVQIEDMIDKTRFTKPTDASHWSCRSMAKETGISPSQVGRIWRTFGIKPHLTETFKLSPDEFFVDKVRDITALYLNAPDAAMLICVDEKSQIQALDRTAPMRPGVPERQTHDHKRNGTTNLYAALDIGVVGLAGEPFGCEFGEESFDEVHSDATQVKEFAELDGPVADGESGDDVATTPQTTSPDPSATGSKRGTKTPAPTSGPRPPTKSSTASPDLLNLPPVQDTSNGGP